MIIRKDEILVEQNKFGPGVFVAAIIAMMTVQWMTLDMYLPALPVLKEEFATTEAILNISFNSDLVLCAIGTLIGGTLSDKYGRNLIMRLGLIITVISFAFASLSQSVVVLIIARGASGLGGGFSLAVGTAMIRDSYKGKTFRTVTTITQAAAIIGPVFAPAIGSAILQFLSWRWIFIALAVATAITAIPFMIATETWPKEKRNVDSVWEATVQSFKLMKTGSFAAMMVMLMLISTPMWAYLGTCSYIFFDFFHVSKMEYSILYAIGTLCAFGAPFLYVWLSSRMKGRFIIDIILLGVGLGSLLMLLIADAGPIAFLIAAVPLLSTEAMIRPMSMVVVLEEHKDEAGSASAITGFAEMIVALPATTIATLQWSNFINGIGVITGACLVLAIILWLGMVKKKAYAKQLGIH